MNDSTLPETPHLSLDERLRIEELCTEFDQAWQAGDPPPIDDFLQLVPDGLRPRLLSDLLAVELEYRCGRGDPLPSNYAARWPEYQEVVAVALARRDDIDRAKSASSPGTLDFHATSQAARLVELIHEYQAAQSTGAVPDPGQWAAGHPEVARPLELAIRGLERLHRATSEAGNDGQQPLGDFRILREIGRGGMGAVFEAEQMSLGRRVALKILWFGAAPDADAVRRFQREAEMVASLHHTNIVPIFSVGSEAGVNYYAMQLIDGRSLDVVAKERGGPIDPLTVVEWGLQAADALAHAHQRGIVHRDVKPSNLLLDVEGQIWLTDFGLAKRSDDVTLSMAGALLGTPRYMSPEQASASTRAVDQRSDIYSLGATLYEFVTGSPVFGGTSPLGVISQILTADPAPPRRLCPAVPRDLETILLKCLMKTPGDRYASAKELADDLRAVLDGRPIRARRAGPVEIAKMWLKRQKRLVNWSLASVAATVCLFLGVSLGWQTYQRSQLSFLSLTTSSGSLLAELFDSQGRPATRPETVPVHEPIAVPAGEYELRLSTPGLLSQTYRTTLDAGRTREINVGLTDQLLVEPIDNRFGYSLVSRDGGRVLVHYDANSLAIRSFAGRDFQEFNLPWSYFTDALRTPGFAWPLWRVTGSAPNMFEKFDLRPWVLEDAVDLDRDGQGDFLIAFRHQACIAAVSNKRGILWLAARGSDVASSIPPGDSQARGVRSAVLEPPRTIGDINADGVPDLLVNLADAGTEPPPAGSDHTPIDFTDGWSLARNTRRWIEAISGADGATIWRYDLPASLFEFAAGRETPYAFRWFIGHGGSSSRGGASKYSDRLMVRYERQHVQRNGPFVAMAHVIPWQGASPASAFVLTGTRLTRISLQTGNTMGTPNELDVLAAGPPDVADVDNDGVDELVLIEELPDKVKPSMPMPRGVPQVRIVVWSIREGRRLWDRTADTQFPKLGAWWAAPPRLPKLVDLDYDGDAEILIPHGISFPMFAGERYPGGTIEAWDGRTGKSLWSRRIPNCDLTPDCFLPGPDVDGDGFRDVFVASLWGVGDRLVVEALSGRDGRQLWIREHALPESQTSFSLAAPRMWEAGEDGWPQLVVPVITETTSESVASAAQLCLFSTGTGKLTHLTSDIHDVVPTDVDGDGVEDLCLLTHDDLRGNMESGTRLAIVRGVTNEALRHLAAPLHPGTDSDGDDVQDMVQFDKQTLRAYSSQDGRLLWQNVFDDALLFREVFSWEQAGARPEQRAWWDFDGDKTLDLLVDVLPRGSGYPLWAVSGRTGHVLWHAELQLQNTMGNPRIECHDIDADGVSELIYYGYSDWDRVRKTPGYSSDDGRLWLAVFSARSGRLKWKQPLSREYGSSSPGQNLPYSLPQDRHVEVVVADGDGDGVQDVFALAEPEQVPKARNQLELRAYRGQDGVLLWRHALKPAVDSRAVFPQAGTFASADVAGSVSRLLLLEVEDQADATDSTLNRRAVLTALNAGTGETGWTWETTVASDFARYTDTRQRLARPYVLRTAGGPPVIAVNLKHTNSQPIVTLINDAGKTVGEYPLTNQGHNFENYSLRIYDCDGDGNDEFLVANGQLEAVGVAGSIRRRTVYPFSTTALDSEVRLHPAAADKPATLVAVRRGFFSAAGFDVASATLRWRCGDMGPPMSQPASDSVAHVLVALPDQPPPVLFCRGSQAICQRAVWKAPRVDPKRSSQVEIAEAVAHKTTLPPTKVDPRLIRQLPWSHFAQFSELMKLARLSWHAFACSMSLVFLPGLYVVRLVRGCRWSVMMVLLLPVIVAVGITMLTITWVLPDAETTGPIERLLLGFLGIPLLVFVGALFRRIVNHRGRTVLIWSAVIVVCSLVAAVVLPGDGVTFTRTSLWEASLEPGETLSFQGWYMALLPGVYVASWLYLVASALRWLGWKLARQLRAWTGPSADPVGCRPPRNS